MVDHVANGHPEHVAPPHLAELLGSDRPINVRVPFGISHGAYPTRYPRVFGFELVQNLLHRCRRLGKIGPVNLSLDYSAHDTRLFSDEYARQLDRASALLSRL